MGREEKPPIVKAQEDEIKFLRERATDIWRKCSCRF
jgi:hypothetical protein